MAERIPDDADLAVDELKRRARRRLVGAIVLALAAAVILPLLLEKEPKPLGDDVSVQIPPIDEGRFINRLTGRAAETKSSAKSDPRPPPKIAPPKVEATPPPAAPAEAVAPPPAVPPETATVPTNVPTNVPPPKTSVAEAEKKVLAGAVKGTVVAKPEAPPPAAAPIDTPVAAPMAPETSTPPTAAPAPATAIPALTAGDGFAVQIAAFTDDKGANSLAGKLKKAGYASTYTEPVETSRGTMWRVRVGGFATRPDADAARAKLKTDGWNGIVVSAR